MKKPDRYSSRNLILLYIASFLVQLGAAMTISYVPLYARDLGAAIALIGAIETIRSLGGMAVNLPGGFLAERHGIFRIILFCFAAMIFAALLRALSPTLTSLMLAGFFLGTGQSMWILARLTHIRKTVRNEVRGRVLAGFGGIMRFSRVVGPLIGSAIITGFGFQRLFLMEGILLFLAMALLVLFFRTPELHVPQGARESLQAVRSHYAGNRGNITAAMIGIFGLTVLRAARALVIPLWSAHIGLSISQLGLIVSISSLLEIGLVVPAGYSVDRIGRKPTLLMTIFIMSVGMLLVPLSHSFVTLMAVSLLIGIGNGLGSGINMIFSTDLAPDSSVGLFIGIWRIFTESGMAAGPFLVGLISDSFTLSFAPPVISIIGIISALFMMVFFRTTHLPKAPEQQP